MLFVRKISRAAIERTAIGAGIFVILFIAMITTFLVAVNTENAELIRLILVKDDGSPIYYEDGNQVYQFLLNVHTATKFNVLSMQVYRCRTRFYSVKYDYFEDRDIYLCHFKKNYGDYTKKFLVSSRPPPPLGEEGSARLWDNNFDDVTWYISNFTSDVLIGTEYNAFFDGDPGLVLPADYSYDFEAEYRFFDAVVHQSEYQEGLVRSYQNPVSITYHMIKENKSVELLTHYTGRQMLEPKYPRYLYNYMKDAAIGYINDAAAEKLHSDMYAIDDTYGMEYDYIIVELTYRHIFELKRVEKWLKSWGYTVKKSIDW